MTVHRRGGTTRRMTNETRTEGGGTTGVARQARNATIQPEVSAVRNETSQQEASAVTGTVSKETSEPAVDAVRDETSALNRQTPGRVTNDTPQSAKAQRHTSNEATTTEPPQEKAGTTAASAL